MDQGSEILATSSSVCPPQGSPSLMFSEIEVEGRNHDDDGPTDGISEPVARQCGRSCLHRALDT